MFWTGVFTGFAACLAIMMTAHVLSDRRERRTFVAGLSRSEREKLQGYEAVRGDWQGFRELLNRDWRR